LSPIGLNVHAGPSKSAPVIGTAAQGAVLQLLGRTGQGGGWYKVQGATVTGWISASPAYSAPGRFSTYSSDPFSVLYPAGWTASGSPGSGVTFKAPSKLEKVLIKAAANEAHLPSVAQGGGVSENSSQQVVACGVTAYLYSYSSAERGHYLADVDIPVAPHHALGLKAALTSLSQLRTVLDFVNSVAFPFPECIGKPPTTTTTSGPKALAKTTSTTSSTPPHTKTGKT